MSAVAKVLRSETMSAVASLFRSATMSAVAEYSGRTLCQMLPAYLGLQQSLTLLDRFSGHRCDAACYGRKGSNIGVSCRHRCNGIGGRGAILKISQERNICGGSNTALTSDTLGPTSGLRSYC